MLFAPCVFSVSIFLLATHQAGMRDENIFQSNMGKIGIREPDGQGALFKLAMAISVLASVKGYCCIAMCIVGTS